jgi:hypothetical protein
MEGGVWFEGVWKAGWNVVGWDNGGDAPDKTRFLFSLLNRRSAENQIDQQQEGKERRKKQTKQ